MAELQIKVSMNHNPAISALAAAAESWSQERCQKSLDDWRALESAGAVSVEFQVIDGVLTCYPSHDFTQHLIASGVPPWW
jgi:hypothetical protein